MVGNLVSMYMEVGLIYSKINRKGIKVFGLLFLINLFIYYIYFIVF